ncbi:helix-turn-helix transcriptional regulator [bacterium]|nr:helix-turn-helix transcriptional regulator [bacterium]
MKDIRKLIGNIIKQKRKEQKMTQQELAFAVDVDPKYISRIETGASYASLSVIEKIFNKLNLDVNLVVENEDKVLNKQELIHNINSNLKNFSDKKLAVIKAFTDYINEI